MLKDGKKKTAGEELTEEELKQVVVNEDLIVTAKYQKEEIVEVPDTAKFSSIISILGGLMFVSFGTVILYTTLQRKRFE